MHGRQRDLLPRILDVGTGGLYFLAAVVALITAVRSSAGPLARVLIGVGITAFASGLLYIAFARMRNASSIGRAVWRFPRARRWTIAIMASAALLAVGIAGWRWTYQHSRPQKTLVLVAEFDGPSPSHYRVTETILGNLQAELAVYDDVVVAALGRAISTAEGSEVARQEGERRRASVIVWGWYGITEEAVPVSVRFEVLVPEEDLPDYWVHVGRDDVRAAAKTELESCELQLRLSRELSYLTLCLAGTARATAEDWDGAIEMLSQAIELVEREQMEVDRSIAYIARAYSHFYAREYEAAIDDCDAAINLNPSCISALRTRAASFFNNGSLMYALRDRDRAIELEPRNADLYHARSEVRFYLGDLWGEIRDLSRTVELDPGNADAFLDRAYSLVVLQDLEAASSDFSRFLELSGRLGPPSRESEEVYNRLGLAGLPTAEAVGVLMKDAVHGAGMYHVGVVSTGGRLSEDEIRELETSIELRPDDERLHTLLLGSRLFSELRFTEPEEYGKYTLWFIRERPDSPVLRDYGQLHPRLDGSNYDRAAALWLHHVETRGQEPAILRNAFEFFESPDWEVAHRIATSAETLDPRNPEWPLLVAYHYYFSAEFASFRELSLKEADEEWKKALLYFQRWWELHDKDSPAYSTAMLMARAALEAGEIDLAEEYTRSSLVEAQQHPRSGFFHEVAMHDGHVMLGRIALRAGDQERAMELLMTAGRTRPGAGPSEVQMNRPDFSLAVEFLALGQDDLVVDYLKLCASFWRDQYGPDLLEHWITTIENGEEDPNFFLHKAPEETSSVFLNTRT